MARARNIKPGFFQNDELAELHPLDRLAFIGMWTIANFRGCIECRPKMLKVQILPYDDCDMESIIQNLEQARFIRSYFVQGKRHLKIINFEKHQNPHKNERDAGTEIPDITEQDETAIENSELKQDGTKPDLIGTARADSLVLIPDSGNLIPDSGKPAPEKPARFDPLQLELPEGLKPESWEEWVSYRLKTGKALKPESWAKQVEFIADCIAKGFDPAEMFAHSIRNGYTGVFEPKGQTGQSQFLTPQQQRDENNRRSTAEFLADDSPFFGSSEAEAIEGEFDHA